MRDLSHVEGILVSLCGSERFLLGEEQFFPTRPAQAAINKKLQRPKNGLSAKTGSPRQPLTC